MKKRRHFYTETIYELASWYTFQDSAVQPTELRV